jgi:phage shock protein C
MSTVAAAAPKNDNLLGICAAVAEDFGFDAIWLRLMLAATVLVSMEVAVGAYVALGLIVLVSRLLAPQRV